MFDFVMKMFSEGDAALPALGMEIPKQLANQLPANSFLYNTKVVDIRENTIFTNSGAEIKSDIIIVATEADNLISKLKIMLRPNIILLLMCTFKLLSHLQTKQ
jgi:protoporphyrinogen oxidase